MVFWASFVYNKTFFPLAVFNNLSSSLTFDMLIIMCHVVCLCFLLFAALWAFWIWMSILFARLGKFSANISPNKISTLFALSCSGSNIMIMLVYWLFYKFLKLSSLSFILFFLNFFCSDCVSSTVPSLS